MKPSQPSRKTQSSQLRILGGKWRRTPLLASDVKDLRPTNSRIRETLFNWLQWDIEQAYCLDAFAGSGALGLEALSRGAAHTTFVDNAAKACEQLRQQINTLDANSSTSVHHSSTLEWLQKRTPATQPYHIVFLDPPYNSALLTETLLFLSTHQDYLADEALIYIEANNEWQLPSLPQGWQLTHHKSTQTIQYGLITHIKPNN